MVQQVLKSLRSLVDDVAQHVVERQHFESCDRVITNFLQIKFGEFVDELFLQVLKTDEVSILFRTHFFPIQ